MNGRSLARVLASAIPGLAITILLLPEAQAAVGRTEATYAVTPNGAPNYTIPIRATEGINGLTPRISIDYVGPTANSRVGLNASRISKSVLGVGFDIAGLSYIRPCPKTIAQDGSAGPVTLTSADRYCLDGARLRQIGTGTYGAIGTQYRTELDQLVRVTIMDVVNGVPSWFKVERPDGLIYEYGGTTDSKLLSGTLTTSTPQFWAVSKIYDRNNNAIRFVYENDAAVSRFRPSYISYTEVGGTGHYKIFFVYQTATQSTASVRYTPAIAASAIHREDKLLDRIELKHDDAVYLAYKLTYQAAGGTSQRLWQVQECAYTPTEDCLPATTLTWLSATAGHDALASSGRTVASGVLPLDVNGDGVKDLVWAASGTWRYILGGPSGFGSVVNTSVAATNPDKAIVLRWNSDGFDDLLIDWSDGKWRVLRGGATGFNTSVVHAGTPSVGSTSSGFTTTVGDLNADGLDDLLTMQLNAGLVINVRFNGASGFGASSIAYSDETMHTKGNSLFIKMTGASSVRRPDFNGDGRTDLLVWACIWEQELNSCIGPPTSWYLLLSVGNAFANYGPISGANYSSQARFGNFNDDNLTDMIYPNASGVWSIGYGRGNGGLSITNGPSHAAHATYQTLVGDYDGDGLDDLYVTKNSPWQWEILRSKGTGFDSTAIPTFITGDGQSWMLIDQDGDLTPDLGRYDVSTYLWRVGAHSGEPGDHLLNATDGLSNSVAFTYLPMTDAAVYVKGTGAIAPVQDIEGEQFLVRNMQVSPAGGTSYILTYKYFTAREHVQGRGYLGMGTREITDSRNGVFTTETYRQDFPYIGAPATVSVKQSSAPTAKTIQSVAHSYSYHTLSATAGNERYLPYRSQTVTNAYEVSGLKDGAHITEITETHTVNTSGNSTFVSVDVKDKDVLSPETGSIYRTEITSAYTENTTDWCIAAPLSRNEKRILPDGTNQTRAFAWQVATAQCRVTQETVEPGGGSLLSLITDLGYDTCGNVNSISTYPAGLPAQTRTTSINYGTRCQRPESITNPLNQSAAIAYSWPLALPSSQADPNNIAVGLFYDGFGRLVRRDNPDGTDAAFSLTACTAGNSWCGKNSAARIKVSQVLRNTSDATIRTDEQFLDGFGRVHWSHSDSLESGPSIIQTDYDVFGRPNATSQPHFLGGTIYATTYARDLIGRVVQSNEPVSEASPTGRITILAYEGRDLRVTDPMSNTTVRRSNVIGQLRAVIDPSPGGTTAYAYHPFGELASITDVAGNITSWIVNSRGFVTGTTDPDSGSQTFESNAYGETERIRDAKTSAPNWTMQFTFDKLSRPLTRLEAEGTTTWTWGTSAASKNIGRLASITSPGSYSEAFSFDSFGRLSQQSVTADGTTYNINLAYVAATGLPDTLEYPVSTSGYRLKLGYEYANGLLKRVKHVSGAPVYWEAGSTDAWGHIQDENFGNGVATFTQFDQASGLMKYREGGLGGGTGLIHSIVDWDLNRNLSLRQDLKLSPSVTENFYYDALNRFDYSQRNGTTNDDVTLNAIGNITWKQGIGNYTYHATKKRAVTAAGSYSYDYDANGNMTIRNGSSIAYTSFNLPSAINAGAGTSSSLSYGAFRNRYKQVAVTPSTGTETTIYVAGLMEKVTRGSQIEYRHYIAGGKGAVAIHTRVVVGGASSTYYLHRDHLGSPDLITDSSGNEVVRPSFAAYGERRDGNDWSGPPSAPDLTDIANITRRGFTGHEHLDAVNLIHMNGRVYEPVAGRFLSKDPIVHVGLSQSPNSYSYVWNNPLKLIDPSGFTVIDGVVVIAKKLGNEWYSISGTDWRLQSDQWIFEAEDGTPEKWDIGPEVTVTASRIDAPSTGLGSQPLPSSTPQGDHEPDPCSTDGTISEFLEQHGPEILDRTLSIVGGVGQIGLGFTICSGVVSCTGGAVLGVHGASNIYEGVTGSGSLLRAGYRAVLGSTGDLAYSVVDISSSVYGLTRGVLRPGTWSLFRNISSDYVPAFRTMTRVELITEGAGLISDVAGATGVTSGKCRP
jgi:RHS repeat-associated protein